MKLYNIKYTDFNIEPSQVRKFNPKSAFLNCLTVSYKLAYLLEKQEIPSQLKNRFFTRWSKICNKAPGLINLHSEDTPRGVLFLAGISQGSLEAVMRALGKKTHALVMGIWKGKWNLLNLGHAWNYLLDDGEFAILDGYSKKHFKLGIQDPKKYWKGYAKVHAFIFFDQTEDNRCRADFFKSLGPEELKELC